MLDYIAIAEALEADYKIWDVLQALKRLPQGFWVDDIDGGYHHSIIIRWRHPSSEQDFRHQIELRQHEVISPSDWDDARKKLVFALRAWSRELPTIKDGNRTDQLHLSGIFPENQSRPMTKKEAAGYLQLSAHSKQGLSRNRDRSARRELDGLIKAGQIRMEKASQKKFVFDVTGFPKDVQNKMRLS
jgi:hypothetical protein